MIMAIIGGIIVLVGTFLMWFMSAASTSDFFTLYDLIEFESEFAYGYLIPIAGIIAMIMAPIAFILQNRNIAMIVGIFGLLAFIFTILVPVHWGVGVAVSAPDEMRDSDPRSPTQNFVRTQLGPIRVLPGALAVIAAATPVVAPLLHIPRDITQPIAVRLSTGKSPSYE